MSAPGGEQQSKEIMKRIVPALQYATLAVDLDRKGNPVAAITNYKLAVKILEVELELINDDNKIKMETLTRQYSDRIEELEKLFPVASSRQSMGPIRLDFTEESYIGDMPEKPPTNPALQPFWLMRVFSKTISQGGYLTPDIWLSPTTWVQSGSKANLAMSTKQTSYETLLQWSLKFNEMKTEDTEAISKELENYCVQLGIIQNTLSKALGYVPEYLEDTPKKDKGGLSFKKVGEKIARGAKGISGSLRAQKADESMVLYVELQQELFDASQQLGRWIENLNPKAGSALANHLRRVSEFFTVVICNIVIKDLNSQIRKTMKTNRKGLEKSYK